MSSREAVHHDRTIRTRSTPGQQTVQKVVRRKKRYVGRPKVRRPIRTPYIRDEEQKQKLIENILENVRIPIVKLNRIDTLTDDKIHKALTTDNDTGAILKKDISLEGEHTESDRTENESVQSDTRTVQEFPILNNREAHRPSAWTRHTGGVGRQAAKAAQLAIKRELGKKRRRRESKQSLEPLLKSTTTDQSISISDKAADTEECVPQTEHDSNAAAETIEEEVRSDTNVKRVFSPVRKRRRPRIDLLVEQSIARSVKRRKVQPDKRSASKTSKVENVHSDLKIPLVKLEHVETARLVAKQKEKKLSSSLEENAFVEVQDDAMNGAIDPNIESDNNATALVARTDVPTTDENLRQRYSLFRDPKVLLPRLEILKDISRPDFSALEVENGLKTPISRTYRKRQPPQDSVSPSSRDLCREKQSSTVCSSITDPDQASNEATEEWERSISPRSHTSTLQSSPNRVTPRFRRQKKRENFSASRNLLESWLTSSNETPFEKGYGGSTVEKSSPQKSSRLPSLERSISPSSVVPDSQSSETLPNDLPEALPKTNSPKDDKETIPKDDAMEEMDQEDAISDSPGDTLALEPEEHSLPPPDDETTPSETVVTNETEATTNQITTEEEATESESGQQFSKSASIVDIGNLARQRESANPVSSNAPTINERSVYQSNQDVPKPVREERTIVLAKSPDDAVEEPKKTHQLDTVKESPKKDVKSYKCVVCDMTFEEYPLLRQHLSIHRKKQNTESGILLDLPSNVTNPKESTETNASDQDSDQVEEITKEGQTISEIAEPEDTASTVIVVEEDIEVDDSPVSCARTNIIVSFIQSDEKSRPCLVFKDQEKCDTLNDETKKSKRIWKELSSLSCTVCSTGFATKIDLAQHLYTHTESELLAAYEAAKEKLQPDRKKEKHKRRRKRDKSRKEEEKRESCVNPHIAALGSSSKDSTEETRPQEPAETSSPAKSTETSSPAKPVEPSSPVKSTETSSHVKPAESSPPIKSADNTAKKTAESASPAKLGQIESVRGVNTSPSNKETALQVDEARKLVTVCECHKNEVANKNCLKIEVVMLCQICRILYRTVECFETHYRCPEYTLCRDNRLHGRSPKLFCTKCALIFSSLQDLRHHLEQHARFNRNGTTDFRCNICKVIFIGIGSIFYAHWSTHLRNPFFLASRLTFPKTAIVSSTRSMQGPNDTQGYLQVAEYMCQLCKAHFSTQDELQNHETECTGRDIIETNAACASILKTPDKTTTSPRTARPATSPRTVRPVTSPRTARPATVEEPTKPKIRMICGLCNDVFFDRSLLYQHTLKTHNQLVDPQYMCISLTAIKRIVVCSICATVCETMQEFNKHWAKHNVMQENFICVRCEKHYTSLETFLEHTSEHESGTKEDLPSCKVLYNGIEYSCEKCNVKFKTQQALSQHVVSHYKDYLSNENPKIPNAEGTIDDGDKARTALLDSEKQIAMEIDPHPAELLQRENNTATAKDATDLQSLNDATDLQSLNDANDLQSMNDINDLQSVNDANDSDDVTTISSVVASNAEVCEIRQPEDEKSQTNPAESNVPSTEQTVAAIENVTACIGNLRTHETEPSTADVDSMEIIEEISLPSTIAESTDSEPGTSAKTAKTVSAAQAEVAQTEASTDDSCTKPKQGFLRVKNMSELMAKPFGCSRCVKAFATTDELVQHTKSHEGIDDSVIVIDDTDDPAELWTSNAAPTNTNTSTANTIRPLATATNEPSTSTAGNAATEPQRKYVLLPLKVNKLKHVPVPAKTLVPVTQAAKSGSGGAAGGQAPAGEKSSPTTAYHKNLQVYSNVIRPNLSTLRIAQRKNSPNTTSVASSTTSSTVASTEASATSNTANQLENSSTNVAPKPRLAPHILRRRSSSPSTKLLASNRPPGAVGTPPATRSSSPSTKLLASNKTPGSVGTPPATTLPTGTEERPNTPIGIGEKHVCMVCPDFSCSKLTEYLLHEISEEHMKRKDKVMRQNMIGTYPSQYQNNYLNTSGGVTLVAEPPNVNAPNVSTVGQAQQLQLHQQQAQLQHQQQQQFQHQQQQQIQCQRQYQRQILPQGYRQPIHPQQQQQQVQPQQQRQLTLYAPQQPQQQLKPQQSQQQQQQQQQRQQFQQFYAVPISEPVVIMQQPYVVQQQQDWTARPSYNVSSNLIPHSSNARPATVVNAQYQIPVSTAAPTLNLNPLRTTTASVCSYCPKNVRFGSEELLQYHINVDHNFLCDICGQRLFNVNELDVHRIKHDLIWSANAFQRNQLEK